MANKTNRKMMQLLPTLVLRGLVVFPRMNVHFDVTLDSSINAVKHAIDRDKKIFLVAQRETSFEEYVDRDEVYTVGVIAKVVQMIKTSENTSRVLVEGLEKAKLVEFMPACENEQDKLYYESLVEPIAQKLSTPKDQAKKEALMRSAKSVFQTYSMAVPNFPKEILEKVQAANDFQTLFDDMVHSVLLKSREKQEILEKTSLVAAYQLLIKYLLAESKVLDYQRDLFENTKSQVDQNQREYFLREQMKIISSQLGEDDLQDEAAKFYDQLSAIKNMDDETAEKLEKECHKLYKLPNGSHEAPMQRAYLETVMALPWDKKTKDHLDLKRARKVLDSDHYGLDKVKERIIELLAVKQLSQNLKGQIICLAGPPGVGKSSIAKSIATAMGRNYARISLGGIKDESDIRGHRRTYIGSMPGRIIDAVIRTKSRNPLILLDEIDKMSSDFRGDPSSAMLEVLDVEQNNAFRDHYIEVPFDLSDVMFITTANDVSQIPAPLLDRMEVISLSSYTREEKFCIAKRHLVKKELVKNGLDRAKCHMTDAALYTVIDNYTREAGVRKLERTIATLFRKAAAKIVAGKAEKVTITPKVAQEMLGPKKYLPETIEKEPLVGVVNGLAWTSVGGELMQIEVAVLDGSGKIELTGCLGDVMKESAKAAITHVRSIAAGYEIPTDFYKTKDIHIHVPEGAVPKDGPSAGLAITTAVVSALSGIAVKNDVAMTGEVTLRGRALPIGGLKEKTMAAYRAGVKIVVIPKENLPDLHEIDPVVQQALQFVAVDDVSEVLKLALVEKQRTIACAC